MMSFVRDRLHHDRSLNGLKIAEQCSTPDLELLIAQSDGKFRVPGRADGAGERQNVESAHQAPAVLLDVHNRHSRYEALGSHDEHAPALLYEFARQSSHGRDHEFSTWNVQEMDVHFPAIVI
ncbi:hypothetical protein MPTK1_6g19760 [Marchantia polymorpha subsp. ruderalis]|uniref:Uncharacterized protein n=2 Tax=Marchantia polymorpha TaxID=3197 RepID=A0AAF6BTX6_MARPO|nr:hypothetical protein MARPO_0045s0087 [Marchantia polymorpha]BBN15460.1 hypothetical protein Mp_6g19760 [Marchantia polymorpha subsp. ruderalis]|eukprot:PTQ39428.1 hypothetical protein MARPO_0045s0087 [Marchantia polymorpha]